LQIAGRERSYGHSGRGRGERLYKARGVGQFTTRRTTIHCKGREETNHTSGRKSSLLSPQKEGTSLLSWGGEGKKKGERILGKSPNSVRKGKPPGGTGV